MWRSGDEPNDEFPVVRRGFDRERVRSSLAELRDEVARLRDELDEARRERAKRELERDEARAEALQARSELDGALQDPDRAAQLVGREAADVLRSATEAAAALRRRAEAQAADLIERARREAQRIEDEARHAAEAVVGEARQAAEAYLEQVRAQASELTRMADRTAQTTVESAKQEGRSLVLRANEHARKLLADAEAKVAERREELANLDITRLSLRQLLEQVRTVASETLVQVDAAERRTRRHGLEAEPTIVERHEITAPNPAVARPASDDAPGEVAAGAAPVDRSLEGTDKRESTSHALSDVAERLARPDLDLAEVTSLIRMIADDAAAAPSAMADANAFEGASEPAAATADEGTASVDVRVVTEPLGPSAADHTPPDVVASISESDMVVVPSRDEVETFQARAHAHDERADDDAESHLVGESSGEEPTTDGEDEEEDDVLATERVAGGAAIHRSAVARERLERLEHLFSSLADAGGAVTVATGVDAPREQLVGEGAVASPGRAQSEAAALEADPDETGELAAVDEDAGDALDGAGDLRVPEARPGGDREGRTEEFDPDRDDANLCPPSLYRRYLELSEPRGVDLARRVKRVVGDLINEVLADLRQRDPDAVAARLVELRADPSRLRSSCELHIQRNVAAGVEFAEGLGGIVATHHVSVDGVVADALARLVTRLDDEVLAMLVRTLEDGGEADDLAQRVGAIHRELRGGRLDEIAHDAATDAFFAGVRSVGAPRGYRWLLDPTRRACPDCEDNALADVVAADEPFPTGHERPPAHPGCRCLVVPVFA